MDSHGAALDEDDDQVDAAQSQSRRSLVATITIHGSNRITTLTAVPGRSAVLSTDARGIVEVWSTSGQSLASLGRPCARTSNGISYESKLDTDLYELVKKKTFCVASAATSDLYALYCYDGKIRIYSHETGRILAKLDERLSTYEKEQEQRHQQDTSEPDPARDRVESTGIANLDALEFGRRAAVEREIHSSAVMAQNLTMSPEQGEVNVKASSSNQRMTIQFDPSGAYLLVPTLLGIKIVDWRRRRTCAILGEADASQLRFLSACLCPGDAKVNRQMELARMSADGGANASTDDKSGSEPQKPINDCLVIALAYQKQRLYIFSHVDPVVVQSTIFKDGDAPPSSLSTAAVLSSRDVWNEAPSASDALQMDALRSQNQGQRGGDKRLPLACVLRTTMGDIKIQLFSSQVPRTIENFAGHAASGYYDGVIFHRVIKGFMLQTGDPLGDGTGGESIWGGEFEDEFVQGLRHDRPFTVSMANAGPNTNGSQFYITTVATPWLDQKHTVFGRVVSGMDVCTMIENVRTDDLDKPLNEIRIVNVDLVDND
jgi:peptidylprolyl isomerase domain and WD repeat-containing protein 1